MQQYAEGFIGALAGGRSKRRLILVVLLFLTSASGVAYSFWNITRAEVDDPVIDIGVGTVLTVSETIGPADGTTLIPYGGFRGPGDVDEYVFVYRVSLNKPGRLVVDIASITVGGLPDDERLVDIAVYGVDPAEAALPYRIELAAQDDAFIATISVRVRLSGQASDAQYLAIQGQPIALVVRFAAESLGG